MIMQVAVHCGPKTLVSGKYVLIVETKHGRAQGTLELLPTTSRDRSPTHPGLVPPPGDTVEAPLYGATDLDFAAVGLPIDSTKSSLDPLFPGVLVFCTPNGPALAIGSVGNRRDGVTVEDGRGLGLFVHRVSNDGFSGNWGPWGIVNYGKGKFRALNRSP